VSAALAQGMGDEVEPDDEAEVEGDEFPWSITPDWVTLAPISDLAYRIYAIVRAHANKAQGGRTSFPSQKTLATILGYAKTDQISAAVQELRGIGAMSTRQVPCPKGRKTIYKTYMEPRMVGEYAGPRQTSDLYNPGVLEGMAQARAKRARGVSRNPSGKAKSA
jgi:hypothetical protein